MDRTWPKFLNRSEMRLGSVTLVVGEPIAGKLQIIRAHEAVARNLGKNAGRCNGITPGITLYDGRVWQ